MTTLQEQFSRIYGSRCPFCQTMMRAPSLLRGNVYNWDRTRAHIHPTGSKRRKDDDWIFACRKCNNDQAHLALDEWWLILAYRRDPRRFAVMKVIREIGSYKIPIERTEKFLASVDQAALEFLI